MMRKSILWFLTKNIQQHPRLQETVAVRKHLYIGRNNSHRRNADVTGFVERMKKNQKCVYTIHGQNKPSLKREILYKSQHITDEK